MATQTLKYRSFIHNIIANFNCNSSSRWAKDQLDDSRLIHQLPWSELMCVCSPMRTFYPLSYEREYHISVCHLTIGRVWPFGFQRQFFMLIFFCLYKQQNNLFNWIRFSLILYKVGKMHKLFSKHMSDRIRGGIKPLIYSKVRSVTLMWMFVCRLTQLSKNAVSHTQRTDRQQTDYSIWQGQSREVACGAQVLNL